MPEGDHHFDANHGDDGSGEQGDGMAKRSCTDFFCLLVFLAFMGGMSYVTQYGYKNGNPKRLTHGFDYGGNLCGVDPGYEERGFLYYCPTVGVAGVPMGINFKAPVCVSTCPSDANETINCLGPTVVTPAAVPAAVAGGESQGIELSQSMLDTVSYATKPVLGLYCMPDLERLNAIAAASGLVSPTGLRDSLLNSTGPIGNQAVQLQHHIGSLRRVVPLLCGSLVFAVVLGYVYLFLLKMCAKPLIYLTFAALILMCCGISGFFFIGEAMARPATLSGAVAAGTPLVAPALAVTPAVPVPAATLITTAAPAVAVAPVGAAVTAAAVTEAAPTVAPPLITPQPTVPPAAARRMLTYEDACRRSPASCAQLNARWESFGGRKKWEEVNPFYNEHLAPKDAKNATLAAGCSFAVLALLFLILMCCAKKSIDMAIGCVKAACEAIFAMPAMLFMPAVELILKVVMIVILLVGLSFLVSSGTLDTKTYATIGTQEVNGLRRHFKYSDEQKYYMAYYVFGMFWLLELANAIGAFVVSFAVVGWYYTPKSPNGSKGHNWCGLLWGYVYACTFHLGTLALGSFMIAVCRFARLILMVIEKSAKAEGNPVLACIAKVLICCITCFEKFFKFINKNAYIDVCITSNNFCGAAHDVMTFLASQGPAIFVLNGACTIFAFTGIASISGVTAYVTYMVTTSHERYTDEASPHHVESPRFVAFVALIGAGFVANAFMVIFDHTADTLLYTYCWNKSKGHNTVQKYAPKELSDLLGYQPVQKPSPAAKGGSAPAPSGGGGGFFSTMFGGGGSQTARSHETAPLMGGH